MMALKSILRGTFWASSHLGHGQLTSILSALSDISCMYLCMYNCGAIFQLLSAIR
jgi:hypothetical protein